ncbi:hypothetical protein BH11MYX1_BH11MYX1_02580 [soil metagenome]
MFDSCVLLALATCAACASADGGSDQKPPTLLAMSASSISIGEPLNFVGGDFLNYSKAGHTEIRFKGTFKSTSGTTYAVDHRVRPEWIDGNHVTWAFVGPYSNPFTGKGGDQLGTFEGDVTAVNILGTDNNRVEAESVAVPATLVFKPSLIIRDLQPLDASCDEPATHVLGGYAYKISVEAVGFTPKNFSYIIADSNGPPRVFRTIAKAQTDTFGMNDELIFAPVPDAQPFYLVDVGVMAVDTDGLEHKMELTIGVHRPIEYIDSGESKIAQIEQARPDSGCLSGGDTNGTTVSYTQTTTDTRTRTLGVTWDENWLNSVQNTHGGSQTTTNSVNWQVSHTDTQNWEFGWMAQDSVEVGGKVGLPVIAEGSLKNTLTGGIHRNHSWGYSDSRSVGGDHSESDTESWATTNTASHSVSQGGTDFWAVSSAESKSLSFTSLILPGQFGVFYRQTTRIATPASIVTYNLCGKPQVVADANFFDYQWSLELAEGPTCAPLPISRLPAAQCLMAPCSE